MTRNRSVYDARTTFTPEAAALREKLAIVRKDLTDHREIKTTLSGDENKAARRKIRKEIEDIEANIAELEAQLKLCPPANFSAADLRDILLEALSAEADAFVKAKAQFQAKFEQNPVYALQSYTEEMIKAQTRNQIAGRVHRAYENQEWTEPGPMNSLSRLVAICKESEDNMREEVLRTASRLTSRSTSTVHNLVEDIEISTRAEMLRHDSFFTWFESYHYVSRLISEGRIDWDDQN